MTTEAQITRTEHIEITCDRPEPMTAERVRELFEDAQYEPRAYSGRCMHGDHCLAVTTDSPSEAAKVVLDVVQACAENGTAHDVMELVDFLRGSRTDSMGRGSVVYWPDISWADCGTEDEDEDNPDDPEQAGVPVRGDREDFHSDG